MRRSVSSIETATIALSLFCGSASAQLYWSDGDSGRFNGQKFRLADVDAPETGGVGAAIGGAECEKERELGFEAKEFIVELTRGKSIELVQVGGETTFGRQVSRVFADGEDVAEAGIRAGMLRPWPHEGSKALTPKPDWCGS